MVDQRGVHAHVLRERTLAGCMHHGSTAGVVAFKLLTSTEIEAARDRERGWPELKFTRDSLTLRRESCSRVIRTSGQ